MRRGFTGDDYRYRFEPEAKRQFLDLLRERFNSGVRYKGRALKWDTLIEQKTVELGRYLTDRAGSLDFSEPSPDLHRMDDRELRRQILGISQSEALSQSLMEAGFRNWLLFAGGVEEQAPETSGVYAFRQSRPAKLARGQSDIAYIGRAMSSLPGPHHNVKHALREYLHPGRSQETKKRIGRRALQEAWEVSWMVSKSPDSLESLFS
jgi:hypothetical protein